MTRRSRPTLLDVATLAGVSKSTVSRVLNNDPEVGLEAHRKVTEAIAEVGYRRNEVARSLRVRATGTIGLITSDLRNEVFAAIAQGVDAVLSGVNRTLLVTASNDNPAHEERALQEFLQRGVDGLIMSLTDDRPKHVPRGLQHAGIPLVLLDRDGPGIVADRVLTDHEWSVSEAVRDLMAHGHTRISLIAPPGQIRPGRVVCKAFTKALGNHDLVWSGPLTETFGRSAMAELLALRSRPTAVVVVGTQVLVGVLATLAEHRVSVPKEMSVVAYDDSAAARFHTPPISALVRDTERIGRLAAELIIDRIETDRKEPKLAVVPAVYEPRGTVVAPPPPRQLRSTELAYRPSGDQVPVDVDAKTMPGRR
jgi:LacI family transcriptional regulator